MDAKSAAEGVKRLERRIDSIQKWQNSIEELRISQETQSTEKAAISSKDMLLQAYNYLKKDMLYSESSLISADSPGYFLYHDGVYDSLKLEGGIESGNYNGSAVDFDPAVEYDPVYLMQQLARVEGRSITRAEAEREAAEYAAEKERFYSFMMAKYNGMKVTLNEEILEPNMKLMVCTSLILGRRWHPSNSYPTLHLGVR